MKREDISNLHGKEYDKAVKRLKRKTTVKKILSDIVGVVLFFGIILVDINYGLIINQEMLIMMIHTK